MATHDTKPLADDFYPDTPPQYQPQYQPQHQPGYSSHNVIVTQPVAVVHAYDTQPRPSAVGEIVASCCVLWFCCWPLGLAAFIYAVMATSAVQYEEAVRKLKTSRMLSVAGLISGIIFIIILSVYYATAYKNQHN